MQAFAVVQRLKTAHDVTVIESKPDPRHIVNGRMIPTEHYCDQPFVVKTDDGAWLCCVTTGAGHEGAQGQHVTTMRSTDCGKTWSAPVPVEQQPYDVENSYAVMLKASAGRVYIFYNHNTDNVREVKRHDGEGAFERVDSLGHFVFKYSDDHGRSWSEKRYDIPFRLFQCDRDNIYGGELCFFWNVGKPFTHEGAAFVSLHKIGQMGEGFMQQSEGVLLKSDNLLSESDPDKITWKTLPDGEVGLRAPADGGAVSEEQSYVVLSDGSFYVNYRTIAGYPVEAYSRDGGHTWGEPQYKCYADGRRMKNPRAANFVWKCENGKYLYWFHNHGGDFIRSLWGQDSASNGLVKNGGSPYDDRNPAWLCGGVEVDSPEGKIIKWSEPEVVLYTDDPFIRMSYPDLVEQDGNYYLTETQKKIARVHEIPADFIEKIWAGLEGGVAKPEPILSHSSAEMPAPQLKPFFVRDHTTMDFHGIQTRAGFSLELELKSNEPGTVLDGMAPDGRGIRLSIIDGKCLELLMSDGQTQQRITSEPCLQDGNNHVVVNIDGGPHIVSFVVNGRFCDGGAHRQFGWSRFSPHLTRLDFVDSWKLSNHATLNVYDRVLMTAESMPN